ncbi:putative zinc-binding metallopeptidase [Candidatus Gracilibacteria bacterium]|nr:putative zinc-binding metallopeptidase [Candidatus Gracilibacteria bacterium]
MKKQLRDYYLLGFYTLLFSALIFVGKGIFFPEIHREEKFVEPTVQKNSPTLEEGEEYYSFTGVTKQQIDKTILSIIYENYRENSNRLPHQKLRLRYIPTSFESEIANSYTPIAETFLYKPEIYDQIEDMGVYFYKNIADTRGRMKGKNIHMFGVEQMSDEEFLGVLVHEFAHYYDIHSLERNSFGDVSEAFYNISWDSVSIIKPGQSQAGFVSGYAMTNQYEDFAESYLYYVLHNADFLQKALRSKVLAQKYTFFQKNVFTKNEFYNTDFGGASEGADYYWDITKLEVDVKNFLQYFQDAI